MLTNCGDPHLSEFSDLRGTLKIINFEELETASANASIPSVFIEVQGCEVESNEENPHFNHESS